jgi:hypothetical protein
LRSALRLLLVPFAVAALLAPAFAEDTDFSELPPADDSQAKPTRSVGTGNSDKPQGDDNVVVPEPGTLALIGAGLVTLGIVRRRRSAR